MLRQMEGARAVAEAVALSRPEVICAHPITPQAHIVEALGAKVLVKRELRRMQRSRRSGPSAQNMLRDHRGAHAH